MKKLIVFSVCIFSFVLLAACSNVNKEKINITVDTDQKIKEGKDAEINRQVSSTTNTNTGKQPKLVDNTSIVYKNKKHGFRLILPATWKDCYYIKETDGEIAIYHKNIWKTYGDGAGRLFTITIYNPKNKWETEGKPLVEIIGMQKIYETDKEVFAVYYPTDVQYDPQNNKLSNGYKQMEKDVFKIVKSFNMD